MKKTILIIEDEEDAARILEFKLIKKGFKILFAGSGEAALEIAAKEHPDLVLLDLMLPGMSGIEVCKALKRDAATSSIPIIIVTAKKEGADRVMGLESGADDYVTKPYEPDELVARVKAVLRRPGLAGPKAAKRILITGGAGFIGSALARELIKRKHEITIIDDFSTGLEGNLKDIFDSKDFHLVRGSITDETLISKAIEQCDLVYHLAATVGVKKVVEKPLDTIVYDTIGTSIVLKYASSKGIKVILTSTSEVYGKSKKYPFREDGDLIIGPPDVNRWSYACSKLLDEFLAKAYHKERGVSVVIVRLFNVVGPGQLGRYGMVIPRFFKSALSGEPIHVYGDGKQVRCFTYIDDIIDILIKLADNKKADGEVINLGSNNQISIKDLAAAVKRITKSSSKIVFEPYHKYYGSHFEDVRKRVPDLTKLKKIIGFTPKTSMQEILEKTMRYFEKNPEDLRGI